MGHFMESGLAVQSISMYPALTFLYLEVVLQRLLKLGLCELVEGQSPQDPFPPQLGLLWWLVYQLLPHTMQAHYATREK